MTHVELDGQRYRPLTNEAARAALEAGQTLDGVRIDTLELDGVTLGPPVVIRRSVIRNLRAAGATLSGLDLSGTRVLDRLRLGPRTPPDGVPVAAHIGAEGLVASGGQWDVGAELEGLQLDGPLTLDGLRCASALDLSGAELSGPATLAGATIGQLTLREARCRAGLLGAQLRVTDEANLLALTVAGYVDFRRARFDGELNLQDAGFADEVCFVRAALAGGLALHGASFEAGAEFEGARLSGVVELGDARFAGWADFTGASFGGPTRLQGTAFAVGADFQQAHFGAPTELIDVAFEGETYLRGATFDGPLVVDRCRFAGQVDLRELRCAQELQWVDVVFARDVHIARAQLEGPCQWLRCRLGGRLLGTRLAAQQLVWRELEVSGAVDLSRANVARTARWTGSRLGGLDLSGARFNPGLDLTDCTLAGPVRLVGLQAGELGLALRQLDGRLASVAAGDWRAARDEYALLHDAFERRQRYPEADDAYLRFRQSERRAEGLGGLGLLRQGWGLLVEWGSGYGTRPLRILALSVVVVLVFGAVFVMFPQTIELALDRPGWAMDYLYFSFTNFTTLGFGDSRPRGVAGQLLVGLEAFSGIFLMALFVSMFTRKVIRE